MKLLTSSGSEAQETNGHHDHPNLGLLAALPATAFEREVSEVPAFEVRLALPLGGDAGDSE